MTDPATSWRFQLWTSTANMVAVVAVNVGFSHSPDLDWFWSFLVGGVLVLCDVAQRH